MAKPTAKSQKAASFLEAARTFYAAAFDVTTPRDLSRSMRDWSRLSEDEQSFAHAHLSYLNLEAQAATQRLLAQGLKLLDEVAESLTTAIEESLADRDADPPPHDDDDFDDDGDDADDPIQVAPNVPVREVGQVDADDDDDGDNNDDEYDGNNEDDDNEDDGEAA
jgi:hypothetical protein